MSSVDSEAVDTVRKALESDGVLQSIKTQLLGKVYDILLNSAAVEAKETSRDGGKPKLTTQHQRLMVACVRDMLHTFDLNCTLSVFDNEIRDVSTSETYSLLQQ